MKRAELNMVKVLVLDCSAYGHVETMVQQPTKNELDGARYQGRRIADTTKRLHG